MKHSIKAIVTFNQGIGLVINEPIEKKYTKYGNTIIGVDGIFHTSYGYEAPSGRFKAFAGAKFDIQLTDGTIEHCSGQWWDGITAKTREIIGDDLISVTACSFDNLKECYVFTSHYCSKKQYLEFVSTYKGRLYGYWEYEAMITDNIYRRKFNKKDKVDFRIKKNFRRFKSKPLIGANPINDRILL